MHRCICLIILCPHVQSEITQWLIMRKSADVLWGKSMSK